MSSLHDASRDGDTERVQQLLDDGSPVDEKEEFMCFTPLMRASWEGHTEVVKLLLDKGALLNEEASDGDTALMLTSQKDHTEVMKLLLDKGALVDVKNKYGNTALSQASQRGHTEVVKLLLEKGALVDEKTEHNSTALMRASEYGCTEVVKLLLEKGASVDEKEHKYGWTALMWASWEGHTEVVKLLLDKGALVDKQAKDGDTALMLASQKDHTEVMKLLLDKGAKDDVKNEYGNTALMQASSRDHTEAVKLLRDGTALMRASKDGRTEVVKLLLEKGASVNEKEHKYGWTALMWASWEGHTEVVKLLLEKGALVDKQAKDGDTALMLASQKDHTEVMKLLLDKGAKDDVKNEYGNTALSQASQRGHTEVVKLLLEKGALVDEKTEHNSTALMRASEYGCTEVVKLLLEKGASVDEKEHKYGWTALMLASRDGHTEVVKLLLGKGASVNEKDGNGDTVLMWAIKEGHTAVVRLLLDKGAALDKKDKDGKTALMLASQTDHTEVGELLWSATLEHVLWSAKLEHVHPDHTFTEEVVKLLLKGVALDQLDRVSWTGLTALMLEISPVQEELVKLLVRMGAPVKVYELERGHTTGTAIPILELVNADEDQLGCMASGLYYKHKGLEGRDNATGMAVLDLVHLAGFARNRAHALRSSDPRSAEDHQVLFARLQLAAAACVQNDESGKDRNEEGVLQLFSKASGKDLKSALVIAVQIEAKELLAQPVVQQYIRDAWSGPINMTTPRWLEEGCIQFLVLLLQLLFLLPLVALVPTLEPWLTKKLDKYYYLRLPVVKFGLECAADLALALAFTLIPAADLATAPAAPLLLVWVGSGLLWESGQLMTTSSGDEKSWLTLVCNRLVAYLADHINRLDATALIFSFAALIAFVSTGDREDATATSLRVAAVFLLWLRVIRVLLISSRFGPFVLMFFRMLFGDVLYFLVLLLFLLVAFAASWTVLLEPESSLIAGCADELGGVEFHTTLLWLLEGAVSPNDHFECARNSTNSPVAAWMVSFVFVTLTAVLLLNMLIAMMAKTFDNISEASATNYLFLFAQRTLGAGDKVPPTPGGLNTLGLPCKAICLLWYLLHPKANSAEASPSSSLPSPSSEEVTPGEKTPLIKETAADFAKKIKPLADKIKDYILDHQDDAAQEDRWRTTMKRDMGKSFRKVKDEMQSMDKKLVGIVKDLGRLSGV